MQPVIATFIALECLHSVQGLFCAHLYFTEQTGNRTESLTGRVAGTNKHASAPTLLDT
jgi:hypothetical protein